MPGSAKCLLVILLWVQKMGAVGQGQLDN
jgi:hypothetical protein